MVKQREELYLKNNIRIQICVYSAVYFFDNISPKVKFKKKSSIFGGMFVEQRVLALVT